MKAKHRKTLSLIFAVPVSGGIKWADIEALFVGLGAQVQERAGSRVAVVLFGQVKVFHRPHPSPDTDKGAVSAVKKWLLENGVTPNEKHTDH
ncbi:type II toxin-antitoxin system HicA family toxin [Neisseria leonii]|uniref:Type II toxin-antitoxin system HicA family toxin n=1 Tax=Neisseria leonii TaxID=2995413 RepID=A0A9X4IE98_9NEIS|nr:type II toxin-antitoxin system HicA family toxin [Neisseria sp. 51.81]MDD9328526.1 type II toxin-antitoxin system HicA family toxin [Neisseria sp. 51.81]